jgi:5-methylcytosine-specific restriction endonuclease McrA
MSEGFIKQIRPKRPRVRLDGQAYRDLCGEVLTRDNWRCQGCGAMERLQVHHQQMRSRSGDDEKANLITLCEVCHGVKHGTRTHDGST